MKKILFILLVVLVAGCEGELMEGVGGDNDETSPTLEQKMRGIWIIGGAAQLNGSGIYSEIDLYDPMTNTWYPDVAANASGSYVPTAFNMSAYKNGKIYVMGGAVSSASTTYAVYEYDITNNSWTTKENIKYNGADTPMMDAAVYSYSNYLYLIGGTTATTTASVGTYHIRFDPSTGTLGTWYNTPPAAYAVPARSSMGASCLGGIAYYFGGRILAGGGTTTNTGYIIATNAFSAALTAITSRGGMAYASYEGTNGTYIFIFGGGAAFLPAQGYFNITSITYVPLASSFQIYVPGGGAGTIVNNNTHSAFIGGTTKGIAFAGASVSNYNGSNVKDPTFYVFGGIKNQNIVSDEVWSITANDTTGGYLTAAWYSKTAMPRARYGHSVVRVGQ